MTDRGPLHILNELLAKPTIGLAGPRSIWEDLWADEPMTRGELLEVICKAKLLLHSRRKEFGDTDEPTLSIMHDLGVALCKGGQYSEAEDMINETIVGRSRALGVSHIKTLGSLHWQGLVYWAQKKFKYAGAVISTVLHGFRRQLGSEHLDTIRCEHCFAVLLDEMDSSVEALEHFRQAIEGYRRILGADHWRTHTAIRESQRCLSKTQPRMPVLSTTPHVEAPVLSPQAPVLSTTPHAGASTEDIPVVKLKAPSSMMPKPQDAPSQPQDTPSSMMQKPQDAPSQPQQDAPSQSASSDAGNKQEADVVFGIVEPKMVDRRKKQREKKSREQMKDKQPADCQEPQIDCGQSAPPDVHKDCQEPQTDCDQSAPPDVHNADSNSGTDTLKNETQTEQTKQEELMQAVKELILEGLELGQSEIVRGLMQAQDAQKVQLANQGPLPPGCSTVMLTGLPKEVTRDLLVHELQGHFRKEIDFLYLPIDFKSLRHLGHSFINFRSHEACNRFVIRFHGRSVRESLPSLKTRKFAALYVEAAQGLDMNMEKYRKRLLMSPLIHLPECMPIRFDRSGTEIPYDARGARRALAKETDLAQWANAVDAGNMQDAASAAAAFAAACQ